jgi:hypothetical protein
MLSSVAYRALPRFATLSPKRHDSREKDVEHKIYALLLKKVNIYEKCLILRRMK